MSKRTKKRERRERETLTSAERTNVYRNLLRMNGAFEISLQSLGELALLLNPRDLREMRGLTQEVQTEINGLLLERLHGIEMDDWATFGKIRAAMEKRLRGD